MNLTFHPHELPLRHVFTISRESITAQQTLIVELEEGGIRGYGEATTNDYYGITMESMTAALDDVRPILGEWQLDSPEALWDRVEPQLAKNPFALCALDQAAHDLWAKTRGKPVYQLWGYSPERLPLTSFTIGIDTIDKMVTKLKEMPEWPIYKIKLGTADDLAIIRELRQHTNATFRVDANCGWSVNETIQNALALQELGVEFIEQPLPAEDWQGARKVFEQSVLPIIADESCIDPDDIERCHGHFHGVNIKLVKCGGLTPARRMVHDARQLDLKVMVGCMTESSVGISAIAQLLPQLDYVDMDGALLLARDVATGVRIERGRCIYSDVPGTGVELLATE